MNRLANESSPYLLQHKNNPVDWWPWGKEAFRDAAALNLPIFLSIGYSSCHWCHVMAHESFEDTTVASFLNSNFISIKVDREERPDIDALYMNAVQALTGSGGWPMSVFLTPEGKPFYAGTYFPPTEGRGLPSFSKVIQIISSSWTSQQYDLIDQAEQITNAISQTVKTFSKSQRQEELNPKILSDKAVRHLLERLDTGWGGFGSAPKFPQAHLIEFLLRNGQLANSSEAFDAAFLTLDAIASGGIYDHLGGGFARYSVDNKWLVPHFEKMLYDQAQLLRLFAIGWAVTKKPEWKQVAYETIEYVLRDLKEENSGIFSSQDADSEGVEGKYYLFGKAEIDNILGQDADAFEKHYAVSETGNFEGSNILSLANRGKILRTPQLEKARQILLKIRNRRVPPALDTKVILEWNAMFASSIIQSAFIFDDDELLATGLKLLQLLESHMYVDNRWMRLWNGGSVSQKAFSSDYAHIVDAYSRAYESTGKLQYLERATRFAHQMLDLFEDLSGGGLFITGSDQEILVVRGKELFDGAMPASNSVAARSLARLSLLTGESRFARASATMVEIVRPEFTNAPQAFPLLIETLSLLNGNSLEIVVPGFHQNLIRQLKGRWFPDCVIAFGGTVDSPLWKGRETGKAYICRNFACQRPISNSDELKVALDTLVKT